MRTRRPTVIGLLAAAVLLTPWRPISAVKRGLAPSIQRVARAHLDGTRRSLRLVPAQ